MSVPGRAAFSTHGLHLENELTRQQGEQVSMMKRVPGVFLQWPGLVGQGRLNEARVQVGLKVTNTDRSI